MDSIFTPGDRVEIVKVKTNMIEKLGADKTKYVSQVIDIIDETTLKITIPILAGKVILLELDALYDVTFYIKKDIYGCEATVVSRGREGKVYFVVINLLTKLQKVQRRQYYRLALLFGFRFADESAEEVEWIDGTVLDISGGGIRFMSKNKYEKNVELTCRLPIILGSNSEELILKGKVRGSNSTSDDKIMYETRLLFEEISAGNREKIIKFIFEEERKQRAKK
ncbi:MAG: uncharacterized protein K0R15_1146 [Clostridiales bacterium]|jgi:c-di-GMP-binding flagellar brake protein YcgR|nr:uncharacterized protein [Clostridiales bacterium]